MLFPSRIRDRGVFFPAVSQARAQTLSRCRGEDGGHRSGRGRPRAGTAGFTGPRRGLHALERPDRLGWANSKMKPGWAGSARPCEKWKRGRGKKSLAEPNSVSSWVSARYQIGTRKILFFFKSFYNLQTNLNSIQI
jgi:hypothetical protein